MSWYNKYVNKNMDFLINSLNKSGEFILDNNDKNINFLIYNCISYYDSSSLPGVFLGAVQLL